MVNPWKFFKNFFLVHYNIIISWIFWYRCFGVLSGRRLKKDGESEEWSKSFPAQGEAGSYDFLTSYVSQPLLPISVFFLFVVVVVVFSFTWVAELLWISFRGSHSIVNCKFSVPMGGGDFRTILCQYFEEKTIPFHYYFRPPTRDLIRDFLCLEI